MRIPFYLLMGNSVETILKSAVVHLSGDAKLAKSLGHDLRAALTCVRELGFEPSHEHGSWLIDALADTHRRHLFRYLEGDDVLDIPDEMIALDVLDDLIVQVGRLRHPDRTRAQWLEMLRRYQPSL